MLDLTVIGGDIDPINAPQTGVFYDIPFDEYLKIPAISKTTLFNANKSLLYFKYKLEEKAKEDPNEVAAHFALGRAIHTAVLEPEFFDSQFVVAPVINKRTNVGKKEWADFQADAILDNKQVLTAEQHDQCMGMSESIANHELSQKILDGGRSEVTIVNYDKIFKCYRKCRIDWLVDGNVLIDLKSIARSSDADFVLLQIYQLGYYLQAGMYLDMTGEETGERLRTFGFLFVETTPPYQVGVYQVSEDMANIGISKYKHLMKRVLKSIETGYWPHYNNDESVTLDFKPWMMEQITKDFEETF